MNLKRLSLFVLLMVFASALTSAEETPNPLDPRTNPDANACYSGGSMDGRCENQNHWNAGWYLIRWEHDLMQAEDIPAQYQWVLYTRIPLAVQGQGQGECYSSSSSSVLYTGPANSLGNYLLFKTVTDCSLKGNSFSTAAFIFANSFDDAMSLCDSIISVDFFVDKWADYGFNTPSNAWACGID